MFAILACIGVRSHALFRADLFADCRAGTEGLLGAFGASTHRFVGGIRAGQSLQTQVWYIILQLCIVYYKVLWSFTRCTVRYEKIDPGARKRVAKSYFQPPGCLFCWPDGK